MEILSSRPTEVWGVKGEGKRWSTGNRARWRLHSACEIAEIPRWRVTPNSRGICEARGWEQLGAELFIELCFEDRPTRPFSFATCRFTSLFGQIWRYRSGATTFTRRKVSVNVVSFSDSRSRTSQNLSAFFVSVITLNYARHVLRKVAISGRDGNLRDFFLRNSEILVTFSYFYKSILSGSVLILSIERNCQNFFAKVISK